MRITTKDLDIFGVPFMFTTDNNRNFKSTFGGAMSIISVFIIFFAMGFRIHELVFRLEPRILTEYFPSRNLSYYNLSNNNFFLGFHIENSTDIIKDYQNYFTITSSVWKYELKHDIWTAFPVQTLNVKDCKSVMNNLDYIEAQDYNHSSGYNCLDFGIESQTKIGGDFFDYDSSYYGTIDIA